MAKTIGIRVNSEGVPGRIFNVLQKQITDRCGIPVLRNSEGECTVSLEIRKDIVREGYRIETLPDNTICILGGDDRGLVAGAGKFLRGCRFGEKMLTPSDWRGTGCPEKEVRGIYFATHFFNFYHAAPVSEVDQYVEELALWGFNALTVWFDMHHFNGINDPAAQEIIGRLHRILKAAGAIGMSPGLIVLANEGYRNTPQHLRAADTGRSHYGVEICPSIPEGRNLILRQFEEECRGLPASLWNSSGSGRMIRADVPAKNAVRGEPALI